MEDIQHTFTKAFELYGDELFRHASMRLSDRDRALELTQECFLRSMQYAKKGGEIRDPRPFLYKTLRNLIIDEYRKRGIVSLEKMAEDAQAVVDDLLPPDESNTLERAVERHEGATALEALQKLPEPYREAIVLRYIDQLSPGEIADIVGESENAVSVRIHRGLKKLRAILEPDHE